MIRRPPRSTLFPYTNALPISGGIDDANALLHFRNGPGVDHLPRLRTYGRVQRDKVAFGQKLLERYQFHGPLSCCRFADESTKRNNAPIEGFPPGCHLAAAAPDPHEPPPLAPHIHSPPQFSP